MGAIALVVDVLQFAIGLIPIVGDVIGAVIGGFGYCLFWLWFKLYGIDFMSPKRFITILAGALLEFAGIIIPEIDLPGLTIAVIGIIILSKVPVAQQAFSIMQGKMAAAKGNGGMVPPGRLPGREVELRAAAEERRPLYGKGGKHSDPAEAPKPLPMAEDPYSKSLKMRRERPVTDEERRNAAIERSRMVSDAPKPEKKRPEAEVLPGDENPDILTSAPRPAGSVPKRIMDESEGDKRVRMVSNETLKPEVVEVRKPFEEKDGDVQKAS